MTEISLLQGLQENMEDWPRWLIVADFYEERGQDNLAFAFRWCSHNKKRPYHPKKGFWTWSRFSTYNSFIPPSALSDDVFTRFGVDSRTICLFSFSDALGVLANALSGVIPSGEKN